MKITLIGIIALLIAGGAYYYFTTKSAVALPPQTAVNQDQVQAKDVTIGTGSQATPGSIVSVLYEGKLENGTTFDSSAAHNNEPLTFQLGTQGLIPGFQVGVNGMKEGGERYIAIPAKLGYGDKEIKDPSGKVIIPANANLVFSVKLVKVQAPPQPQASSTAATTTSAQIKASPVAPKAK
jgi:FKBP-type peptidyl-prolyl cis-trans isomerase